VLGQVSERFRGAVKMQAEREDIPVFQFKPRYLRQLGGRKTWTGCSASG